MVIRFGVSHTKDHGYAPFLVITIRSYPYSWFITGLVTRVTWQNSRACPRIFTCFSEIRVVRVVKLYGFTFFSSVFCLTTMLDLSWLPHVCKEFMFYLCYLYFFYAYWCPTRFPYQMVFVSLNSNTTGVTFETETVNPVGTPEFIASF
jgi:hypothetical protein